MIGRQSDEVTFVTAGRPASRHGVRDVTEPGRTDLYDPGMKAYDTVRKKAHEAVVVLRPARRGDYPFAEEIYIDSMRPLMLDLGHWNEAQRRAALRRSYRTEDVSIIMARGADIGWMQVSERDTDFNLAQLQLLDVHCGHGIGTRLIQDLQARARGSGKTVSLSVVRTNRAIALYRRLGFEIVDPDATPILDMVWTPED